MIENSWIKRFIISNRKLYGIFKPYIWEIPYEKPVYNEMPGVDFLPEYKSYGMKNADSTIAVISHLNPHEGTFERWFNVAARVQYALSKGYIPVIDFKYHKPDGVAGEYADPDVNYWDIHFKQYQTEISVDEVYESKNVVLLTKPVPAFLLQPIWHPLFGMWTDELKMTYRQLYSRIGVKEDVFKDVIDGNVPEKCLGVILRRSMEAGNKKKDSDITDWRGHHTRGHIESYLKLADTIFDNASYDYVFIASDDREGLEALKKRFGDKCIYYNRKRIRFFVNGESKRGENESMNEFSDVSDYNMLRVIEKEYISETIMLSKCSAVLSNPLGQDRIVTVMSNRIRSIKNDLYLDMFEEH